MYVLYYIYTSIVKLISINIIGDAIELKDGETTYLNARLDFYNSLLNYNVKAAELEKEIGSPLKVTNESILKGVNN